MGAGLALQAIGLAWIAAVSTPTTPYVDIVVPFVVSRAPAWRSSSRRSRTSSSRASATSSRARPPARTTRSASSAASSASPSSPRSSPHEGGYTSADTFVNGMNAAVYVGAAVVAIGSVAAFAIRRSRRAEVARGGSRSSSWPRRRLVLARNRRQPVPRRQWAGDRRSARPEPLAPRPRGGPGPARAARGGTDPRHLDGGLRPRPRGSRASPSQTGGASSRTDDEPALERLASALPIDGVISPGTDPPVAVAARIAEKLGLPHPISSATAVLATNKLRQREALAEAGVPQPRWQIATQDEAFDPPLPAVVKAADRTARAGLSLVAQRRPARRLRSRLRAPPRAAAPSSSRSISTGRR